MRTLREKAAVCKPERELSPEAELADILVTDSSLQNSEEIHFRCLHRPVCGILLWFPEQTCIGWMYKRDGFEDGKAFQAKKTAEQRCGDLRRHSSPVPRACM